MRLKSERPTKARRVSSKTMSGPSKVEEPNIADTNFHEKGRPTRMKIHRD
jgi:hypothetical protein